MTTSSWPSLPICTIGAPQQEAIAGQGPSWLIVASRSIESPIPTTCMILAPSCNNQIHVICSADFDTNIQLPIDHNQVQFCMGYHLCGHCNDNYMHKAWHRALTTTEIAQRNKFLGPYVATPTTRGPTTPSTM